MNLYRFSVSAVAFLAAQLFTCAAASAYISTTTAAGRTVTVTAVTPNILRVDNTAAGENAAPVQSVLDLAADAANATVKGNTLQTAGGIYASFNLGVLTIGTEQQGSMIVDNCRREQAAGRTEIALANGGRGSFYGAGERGHKYNLRGDTLVMYNRQNYGYTGTDPRTSQMNITMPLVLSTDGYALVFDDYAAAELALTNPIKYTTESHKPVSYYYVGGVSSLADLTEALTQLTGRQPLAPLWSLGYITSKYGYRTQAETEGTIDTLKTRGYPVDGIVLDLYWYGKEQDMGRLEWEPSQWAEPEAMLGRLKERGVKLITISQPYVLRNGRALDNYKALAERGMFVRDSVGGPQEVVIWVGEGGMFDVSNPDTRKWLRNRYKELTDKGVTGWWGDLGEPEVHPEEGMHANGLPARLYHNKYGNDWSSIISELYAEEYPDTRLMTLMRGGTIGLQRHSVFPWSTDVSRSWGGLEPQVRIMLNSGLSGLGYMSSDLGGFAVDPANPYQPELYVRWLQCGLFSPVFRTHAQQYAEPYNYPQYEAIIKAIVKERYRWLPYNYTLAYENAAFGYPLVRPLDFKDTAAKGVYDNITDEYRWGDNILVAPVVSEGATSRKVVLPADGAWYDYYTGARYEAGTTIADHPAPLDRMPLFVREGSFIATADYPMENTGDYRADMFTLNYYPAKTGVAQARLYDDDHVSPKAIESGMYRLYNFTAEALEGETTIEITSTGSYEGAPAAVTFAMNINCLGKKPKAIKVNGKKTKFDFNNAGTASFNIAFKPGKPTTIKITE